MPQVQLCSRTTSGQPATPLRAITERHDASSPVLSAEASLEDVEICRLPRILIAGAGIGGLVLAVALLKRGFRVQVFERDLTAVRGEGKYRGPIQVRAATALPCFCWRTISNKASAMLPWAMEGLQLSSGVAGVNSQIQSNALAALEAIDSEMAEEILAHGCVTGDRVNGLCDGVTGDWCAVSTLRIAHVGTSFSTVLSCRLERSIVEQSIPMRWTTKPDGVLNDVDLLHLVCGAGIASSTPSTRRWTTACP